jgi:hypothetical protein
VRRLADEVRTSVNEAMRSLRADLAAAARDARQESRAPGRVAGSDPGGHWAEDFAARNESRNNLQEAEVLLSTFRHQVRAELREWMSTDRLSAATIDVLRFGLRDVRTELTASLQSKKR